MNKTNVQFYSKDIRVEADNGTTLVTLTDVDLSELSGQVFIDDLLSGWDLAEVNDYVERMMKAE